MNSFCRGKRLRGLHGSPQGLYLPGSTDHYFRARVLWSAPGPETAEETGRWAAIQFMDPDVWMHVAIEAVIETAGEARE